MAGESETENFEAPRLLETLTRLKEIRRRYASEADDGKNSSLAEDRLDSIISDLDGWLKPGGRPIEFGELDLRLAAVEEMFEATGFPGRHPPPLPLDPHRTPIWMNGRSGPQRKAK